MRLAALSDVHGNLPALDAVLEDVAARGADMIVNLGDICSGPLFPAETADRLIELDLPTIRGNHERQLLEGRADGLGASDAYALQSLRPNHLRWLAGLPPTLRPVEDVLICHGTPTDDVAHLTATLDDRGIRPATAGEIEARLGAHRSPLTLCGHTHLPATVWLPDGRLVVNPGSVGLPAYEDEVPWPHRVETGSPLARYALLERGASGCWSVDLVAVAYDTGDAVAAALDRKRADWAVAIATGRAV